LALACGVPVVALGKAVYDIAGLTFQGGLDDFWSTPAAPDADLFDAFRRVLADRCLIPGSFFNKAGLRLAVDAAVKRLEAGYARPARGHAVYPSAMRAGTGEPIEAAISTR
jgi:capsular polysaccharide export protein